MITSTNKLSERQHSLPTKYDIENILNIRKNQQADNQALEKSFYRTKMGMEGEQILVEFLEKYGEPHWQIICNVWIDYYGRAESDLMLLTHANVYSFEVKNYIGVFSYQDGICRINGQKLANNCVTQAMRMHTNIQGLCKEARLSCKPKQILLFTGEHNRVIIQDKIMEIEVLERQDILYFINEIKKEEVRFGRALDYAPLFRVLEKYEIVNPFLPQALEEDEVKKLRRGVACRQCEKFEVELAHFYARCQCGFVESRDEAILRTICDYGVLAYDRNLEIAKLYQFFNKEVSKENLYRLLRKHFELVRRGRSSYYINKKLPYDKLKFS